MQSLQSIRRFIAAALLSIAFAWTAGCTSGRDMYRVPLPSLTDRQGKLPTDPRRQTPREHRLMEHYFLEGSLLEMRGRYNDAIREYRNALQFNHAPGAVYYALSKCFRALGREDSARLYAGNAVRIDPENTGARVQFGELLLENGEFYRAAEQFEEVVRIEPSNTQVRYTLARMWQRRDPDRAISHYEQIRYHLGDNFDALLNLTELYLERRRYHHAIDAMKQIMEMGVINPDIFRMLADTYRKAGRFDEVILLIDDAATRLASDSLVEIYITGQLVEVNEELGEGYRPEPGLLGYARALAERSTELIPRSARAALHGGLVFLYMDDTDRSDSMIAHALRDSSITRDDWIAAAAVYRDRGEFSRTIRLLAPTADRFYDAEVSYQLGTAYAEEGSAATAEQHLQRAVELDESRADAWGALGSLYRHQENIGAALSAYEKAISFAGDNPEYLNACAALLAERGIHLDRALALGRLALRVEPENEVYLHTVGWIYLQLEDHDRALQYIQRSIAIGGAGAEVYEHLGDVHLKRGDHASARDAYRQALRIAPDDGEVRRKLDGVE